MRTLNTRLKNLVAALAAATVTTLSPLAHAVDYTDLWWTPSESGWGVNLVQADTFIFATFFIYGPDKNPTWYTAQLSFDGTSKFTGPLYLTQGTYYAAPWATADKKATQVGTATFTPSTTNAYQGTLVYTVNNVPTVTKAIERQALTTIVLGGAYSGAETGTYTQCTDTTSNGSYRDFFDLEVTQVASGVATFNFVYANLACTMSGTLDQRGQLYRIPGASYRCTQNGNTVIDTTAAVSELKATGQGIEGRLSAPIPGNCRLDLQFSAVLQ